MMTRWVAALSALTLMSVVTVGCAGDEVEEEQATTEAALAKPAEVDQFWKRYEARDKEDIEKQWKSNNGGRAWGGDYLAWHESFLETALVDMYVATKDPKFLDELVKRADVVFSLRDDRINRKDEVRGKVVPGWGRFPDVGRENRTGDWVVEMVQNGLITFPIAQFVNLAEKSAALKDRFGADKIARYRDRLVETVDLFDSDWDDGNGEGFYRFPNNYGKVYAPHEGRYLPYNRALVLGRTMVMLEGTNINDAKKSKYRERVRKMASFFLKDARKAGTDDRRLVWGYATWEQAPEDIAHAGLDVDFFAVAGEQASYSNVGKQDIERFIETFKYVSNDEGKMARAIDAKSHGNDQKDANQSCGRFLGLAAHDRALATRCKKQIDNGDDPKQLGFAKMLRYRR